MAGSDLSWYETEEVLTTQVFDNTNTTTGLVIYEIGGLVDC